MEPARFLNSTNFQCWHLFYFTYTLHSFQYWYVDWKTLPFITENCKSLVVTLLIEAIHQPRILYIMRNTGSTRKRSARGDSAWDVLKPEFLSFVLHHLPWDPSAWQPAPTKHYLCRKTSTSLCVTFRTLGWTTYSVCFGTKLVPRWLGTISWSILLLRRLFIRCERPEWMEVCFHLIYSFDSN